MATEPTCGNCPYRTLVEIGTGLEGGCGNPDSPWYNEPRPESAGGQCPDHPTNEREWLYLQSQAIARERLDSEPW